MDKIAAKLNCEPNEEAILAAISALQSKQDEMANSVKDLDALKNRAETAEASLATIQAEKDAVDAKVREDALTVRVAAELAKYPALANRAAAEEMLRKDFDGTAALLAAIPAAAHIVPGKSPEDLKNSTTEEPELHGLARVAAAFKK